MTTISVEYSQRCESGDNVIKFVIELARFGFNLCKLLEAGLSQFVLGKLRSHFWSPRLICHDNGQDFVTNRPAEVVNFNWDQSTRGTYGRMEGYACSMEHTGYRVAVVEQQQLFRDDYVYLLLAPQVTTSNLNQNPLPCGITRLIKMCPLVKESEPSVNQKIIRSLSNTKTHPPHPEDNICCRAIGWMQIADVAAHGLASCTFQMTRLFLRHRNLTYTERQLGDTAFGRSPDA